MLADGALAFDEPSHTYTLHGKRVPGVTEVLDTIRMLDGVPPEVLAAAGEFGTHVHQACHLHNMDDLDWDSLDPRLALYVRGYRKFVADTGFKVIHSERRVASARYSYAGTLDLYGELRSATTVIDLKSTASLPLYVGPQCAAYQQALQDTTGEKSRRRYCLHLKPEDYRLIELKNPQDFNDFVSCLNVYRMRQRSRIA